MSDAERINRSEQKSNNAMNENRVEIRVCEVYIGVLQMYIFIVKY